MFSRLLSMNRPGLPPRCFLADSTHMIYLTRHDNHPIRGQSDRKSSTSSPKAYFAPKLDAVPYRTILNRVQHSPNEPTLSTKPFSTPEARIVTLRDLSSTIVHKLSSWANVSLAIALFGASGLVVFYWTHLQEVPFSGRKQFNFVGLELTTKWEEKKREDLVMNERTLDVIEKHCPQLVLPDEHPLTLAVIRVFKRFLQASNLNDDIKDDRMWSIWVLDVAGKLNRDPPFQLLISLEWTGIAVGTNNTVLISTTALALMQNEAVLTSHLAFNLAPWICRQNEELLSHRYLQYFAPIPGLPLIITTIITRRFPIASVLYVASYAATWWKSHNAQSKFEMENEYVTLKVIRKAGYDMKDSLGCYVRGIRYAEQFVSEMDIGTNMPEEVCLRSLSSNSPWRRLMFSRSRKLLLKRLKK